MSYISLRNAALRTLFAVLLLVGCVTACGGAPENVATTSPALSVGVFAECELPAPLKPLLDEVGALLLGKGVDIKGEAILVYDHDLACGGNTLELLIGGSAAWNLGAALGLSEQALNGLLGEVGATAGLLVTATVGLDFGGTWEGIQFAVDGYVGGDILGTGAGTWKVLWSTDKSEVGQTGFWGSITVASDGACEAGGVAFASNSDLNVLKSAWNYLTGGGSTPVMRSCGGADGGAGEGGVTGGDGGEGGAPGSGDGGGGSADGGSTWGGDSGGGGSDAGSGSSYDAGASWGDAYFGDGGTAFVD